MADIEPSPSNDYQVGPTLAFSRARWNAVMASIAARLKARELLEATFETLIANGTQAALDLISQNVAPQLEDLIEQINALEEQLEDIIGGGTAPNALQLAGQNPSYYLALANATGTLPVEKVTGVTALIDAAVSQLVNGSPAILDTFKEIADALGGDANFATSMAAALGNRLRFDSAQALTPEQGAQARSNLKIDRFNRPRNRIINGSMRVNQRGINSIDVTTGDAYIVDRFRVSLSSSPGGTLRAQYAAAATPAGSNVRLRVSVQAVDNSLAPPDYYVVQQAIEGFNLADAAIGTPNAKPLVYRMGLKTSVAGAYTVSLVNADGSKSWASSFTVAPGEVGTDIVRSFSIPAQTTGNWEKTNLIGATLRVCLGSGSNWQGVTGWNNANVLIVPTQVNFMATAGATFEMFDVGLYVDHDGTGIVPPYELPSYADELIECMRFWEKQNSHVLMRFTAGGTFGGGVASHGWAVKKRVQPSVSGTFQGGTYHDPVFSGNADVFTMWFASGTSAGDYATYDVVANAEF